MRRLAAALALVCGSLAACGADEDEPGRALTAQAGEPIEVVGDEYRFDPQHVVLRGAGDEAPAPVRLVLRNEGTLAHNLRVLAGGRDVGGTPTFQGGEARPAALSLAPGRYRLVCTVGDHENLGMVGSLVVEP